MLNLMRHTIYLSLHFLVWYGNKLIEAGNISLEYFKSIGIAATSKDIAYLSKMIGLSGKTITKGSPLWNLGKMGEMRQRMQDLVMNAVSSGQKYNVLVRNIRPLLKSSKAKRSALSKYYLKYAYNPIMQALNGTSYHLAQKYGLTEFVYAGGLVEKSRHFCIERNGNKYSIEEGKSWNNLDWRGKIDGVDFFIQLGGVELFPPPWSGLTTKKNNMDKPLLDEKDFTPFFIYEKGSEVEVLHFKQAAIQHKKLLAAGWRHTETIEPLAWINELLKITKKHKTNQ